MRYSFSALVFAVSALSQYSSPLLPSNPGGAVPAAVQTPTTAGFQNATVQPSRGGFAVCSSGFIDVYASTTSNVKINLQLPLNQSELTELFISLATFGPPPELFGGPQSANGTYKIAGTLCTPANNTSPDQVQILTHGVAFDRYYWDFAPGYSWADVAAKYGHATFFYDRLSVGKSDKPDPINEAQGSLEVEVAHQIIQKLRAGHFGHFTKVVGVGHSFGSVITQGITARYPADLDAAILTGFSVNTTGLGKFLSSLNLAIARENAPYRFSPLSTGYIVSSTPIGSHFGFFRAPGFDPDILNLAEATKGTATVGEFLSQFAGNGPTRPASNFTGPVAVVNGVADLPFCNGNCSYPSDLGQQVLTFLYPSVSKEKQTTYVAENAGHGLNLHYSAVEAYHFSQQFLDEHGM